MFNRLFNKFIIVLCVLDIISSSTLTVYAEEYKGRSENDYNVSENEPLSEEEIDELLDEENKEITEEDSENEQTDDEERTNENETLEEDNEEVDENEDINQSEDDEQIDSNNLLGSSFNDVSLNEIIVSPQFDDTNVFEGAYVNGLIISEINDDYVFDHLDYKIVGNEELIESIDSLDEDGHFSSSLIPNLLFDTNYQVVVNVYYSKEIKDESEEVVLDPDTSSPLIDTIKYEYLTDNFVITELNKNYLITKLARTYDVKTSELTEDNNIDSLYVSESTIIFLRNPKDKYEPISLTEQDIDVLKDIGYIDSNTYINDVNIATGNYNYYNNDLFIDEYDGIYLDRYYNSKNKLTDSYFANFTSSLDIKLIQLDDYYCLILEDGRVIKLIGSDSTYHSLDYKYVLTIDSNNYIVESSLEDKNKYVFNEYFELTDYFNKYGLIYSLIYDDHVLSKLVTKANKELTFELNSHSQIIKINLPNDSSITYEYDNDKLITVTDQMGFVTRYVYDSNLLTQVLNNDSKPLYTITYDDNKVSSFKNGEDNSSTYTYGGSSFTYLDPNNNTFIYELNSNNEAIKVIYPDNTFESFTYDDKGNITSFIDRIGQTTTYLYDSNSNLIKKINPNNSSISSSYDSNNNLLSTTDEKGNITTYEYDSSNNLIKVTYDDGTFIEYFYDDRNRMTSSKDEEGKTTTFIYNDFLDKPLTIIDPKSNTTEYTYDELGNNLTTTIDSKTTTLEYDKKSNLIKSISGDNKVTIIEYNANGLVTKKVDENGSTTSFKYDLNDRVIEESIGEVVTKYEYDGNNNQISKTDPRGNKFIYEYDFDNNLIKTIDPDNISSGNTFDAKGNITSTTDKNGYTEYFEYDLTLNKVIKHIDKLGRVYKYTYDKVGNKLSETLPDGTKLEYTYDSKNRVLSSTTEQGIKITYTYDNKGNITRKENSLGNFEEYTYDSNSNLKSEKDALGNETKYEYDGSNRLTKKIEPNGLTTTYSYDAVGNLTQEKTNGHVTKYSYSGDNLTSKTDPNGYKVTYSYDGSNRPTKETYSDGSTNSVVYDKNSNVIQRIDQYGNKTLYEYDSNNYNTKVTDAKGNITLYEYDKEGNNTKITYPNGKYVKYTYNALSWLTRIEESTGLITDISYDTMGRIISTVSNNGVAEYSTYDSYGNLIETKDQEGNTITYTYNQRGLLLTSSSYTGEYHEYTYDILERLVSSKDNKGIITTYDYDSNSNLIKTSDSLGHSITNTLDLFGNIIESKDSLGIITKYEYDSNNNVSKVIYEDGTSESFKYDYYNRQISHTDANGNTSTSKYDLNDNLLEEVSASGFKTIYEYDENHNLKAKKEGEFVTTYEYDSMGNNTKIIDPYNAQTIFTYDLDNNLISSKDAYDATTSYSYDNRNNLIKTTYDNGLFIEKEYDSLNRVISSKDTYGLLTTYTYDDKNNLLKIENDLGQEESFEYDEYNRVINDTVKGKGYTSYTYDLNDNILSKTINNDTTTYDYDLNNRLLNTYYSNDRVITNIYNSKGQVIEVHDGLINDYRTYKYEYDNNGNLIKYTNSLDNSLSYSYDSNNRLIAQSDYLGNSISYTYDDFNNPLTITDYNGNTTTYEYDYYGNQTKIIDALGNVTLNEYDLMSNLIKTTDPSGRVSMYEYDSRGNLTKQIYNSASSPLEIEDQREVIYRYDEHSNLLNINNGKTGEENEYDDYGRLSKVTYPNGSITLNEYDYNSNLIKTSTSLKKDTETTKYIYDDLGRLKEAVNNNGKTTYSYNDLNELVEVNETGSITKYEYDIYGNVSKLTYPDKSTVLYSYDDENNVVSLEDSIGTSSFEYDSNNNLISQITPSNTSSYAYDNNGNKITAINKDLKDNLISSYSYEYNPINNVSKETISDLKGITISEYEYNESSEISKLINTDNNNKVTITEYEFDIYGNKSKEIVTKSDGTVSTSSYVYNNDNQLTEKYENSKVSEKYKYDDYGNLISKSTKEGTYKYTYTPSNKLEETYLNDKLESRYTYNTSNLKSYELLRKEYPIDYEVDDSYYTNINKFTNELENNKKDVDMVKEVDDSNKQDLIRSLFNWISIPIALVTTTILFIAFNPLTGCISLLICGVLIGGTNLIMTFIFNNSNSSYKHINKTIEVLEPALMPEIIRKLINLFHVEDDIQVIFEPTKYSYDYTYDNPLILTESYNSSTIKSSYVYLNNRLVEDTKTKNSYLYDGKYSISEVVSKSNTLSLRYDIYGNIKNNLTQEDKPISYNTLQYTPQNNLYYIRARYYDPSTGTFISKDTYLGNIYKPATTNRYAYCSGDPINYTDQNGHFGLLTALVIGVAAVVIAAAVSSAITKPSTPNSGGGGSSKGGGGSSNSDDTPKSNYKKNNYNTTPNGVYTDSGFDSGSSHNYVQQNPRQYYYPLITGPYAVNNNVYYYTYGELTNKKTIKNEVLSNDTNISSLDYITAFLSDSACAMIVNNISAQGPLGDLNKAAYGRLAHNLIAEDIKKMVTETSTIKVYTNSTSINKIVSNTIKKEVIISNGKKPDVSIITKNINSFNNSAIANIYEIKPSTQEDTGKGDAQLQKYVDTFNSYPNISAQKGGYSELDSKLGMQNTHTIIYNGVEVSYYYSGNGMIYYDAPWDKKIVEHVPDLDTEKEKNADKKTNAELLTIEIALIFLLKESSDKFFQSAFSLYGY